MDIYFTRSAGLANELYMNNGTGAFVEMAELAGVAVDVLINNSGVNPDPLRQRFDGELDYSEWAETMNVNGEPSQFRRLEPATTN